MREKNAEKTSNNHSRSQDHANGNALISNANIGNDQFLTRVKHFTNENVIISEKKTNEEKGSNETIHIGISYEWYEQLICHN